MAKAEERSIASLIRDAMADYLRQAAPEDGAEAVIRKVLPGPGRYRIYAEVKEA